MTDHTHFFSFKLWYIRKTTFNILTIFQVNGSMSLITVTMLHNYHQRNYECVPVPISHSYLVT